MLGRFRSHLSYANVMATVAVFVALGGSSYAAVALSKNSVKSKHIGKGQVKRSDVARNAVTSAKVKNLSLLAADFKAGQLPAGATGPAGAMGPQGLQGPPGPTGIPPEQTLALGAYASSLPDSAAPLTGGCINLNGGATDFVRLDLPLPNGAEITAVRVRYQDTSPSAALAASVHFVTFTAGSISDDVLAPAVSSAPPPVVGLLNLDLGGDPAPVSATRIYYVNVNAALHADGFTRFCGASVDYTLP